jgi:trigger factor
VRVRVSPLALIVKVIKRGIPMQASIEKLSDLERKLVITVSAEEVEKSYQEELKKVAQTAQIKGFRQGKVPFPEVERRFGNGILYEIAGKLMNHNFEEAVTQNKLKVVGTPQIQPKEIHKDKPFEFEATFEVLPEIEIKDVSGLTVEKPVAEITQTDIENALKETQKHYIEWKAVERAARDGDRVKVDFEGFIDGKPMQNGSAKDFQLELGSNSMIPGFEAGIVGGELKKPLELNLTFPADYHHKTIAGKAVNFKVAINSIEEPKLPPLDDELARKLGESSIDSLKKTVSDSLDKELQHCLQNILKSTVLEKLIEIHSIALPKALVTSEIKRLKEYAQSQAAEKMGGRKIPEANLPDELFREQAEKRVALGLLLGELIKKHGIKADPQKIKEKIAQIASMYKNPEQITQWYSHNKEMIAELEAAVLEEQIVVELLKSMKTVEKKISYKEAVEQVS